MPSLSAAELAELLANSQSSTIYVDADLNDQDAAALLTGTPPLHAEHDAVRGQWAVRAASEDEAAQAKTEAEAASTPAELSATAASSSRSSKAAT